MAQPISGLESSITGLAKPVTVSSISSTKMGLDVVTHASLDTRIERYDYTSATTIYVGVAPRGTDPSSTGWVITKYDLTDTSDATALIAEDVSWDDRATGTYS